MEDSVFMLFPESCTVENLAEVFARCKQEIVEEWRERADFLLRELHLDKLTLTDHMPNLVGEIILQLSHSRGGSISLEQSPGSPPIHGVQRFYDGLNVDQVVAEYNLLRIAFITIAERHELYVLGEAARIINGCIDHSVRLAVKAFAEHQASIRQQREEEHLAFVAHDLRTPLNAVSLVVEELKNGMDHSSREESTELFAIIRRNLQHVEDLIKNVLESSIETSPHGNVFRPERRLFELWPLAQRIIYGLQPVSTQCQIEIVNQIQHTLLVYADAGMLSQVFQNLLVNAFKYAERGQVTLTARETDSGVTCQVCDNGSGIPPEMLPHVFDKLVTDPTKEGTGLGLAIVKQIIEAHGGEVNVESTPGNGATFLFTLPSSQGDFSGR